MTQNEFHCATSSTESLFFFPRRGTTTTITHARSIRLYLKPGLPHAYSSRSFPVQSNIPINETYTLLTYLSLDQVNALWNSIDSKQIDEILVWRYNIPITRKSFNTIHMASSDQGIGWLNDEVKTTPFDVQVFWFVFSYSIRCLLLHLSSRTFLSRFLTRNVVSLFVQLISLQFLLPLLGC